MCLFFSVLPPFLIGIIGLKHINGKENKVKEEKAKTIKKVQEKVNSYNLKKEQYVNELRIYYEKCNHVSEVKSKIKAIINDDIASLNECLVKLYNLGIVFPKYHDWISICSFIVYLESGRCETLEGKDGAYNIYESEKRMNLLITEVSKIGDNLEAIKRNQYVLYTSMIEVDNSISSILIDINNQQSINAYENRLNVQVVAASNYLTYL